MCMPDIMCSSVFNLSQTVQTLPLKPDNNNTNCTCTEMHKVSMSEMKKENKNKTRQTEECFFFACCCFCFKQEQRKKKTAYQTDWRSQIQTLVGHVKDNQTSCSKKFFIFFTLNNNK